MQVSWEREQVWACVCVRGVGEKERKQLFDDFKLKRKHIQELCMEDSAPLTFLKRNKITYSIGCKFSTLLYFYLFLACFPNFEHNFLFTGEIALVSYVCVCLSGCMCGVCICGCVWARLSFYNMFQVMASLEIKHSFITLEVEMLAR